MQSRQPGRLVMALVALAFLSLACASTEQPFISTPAPSAASPATQIAPATFPAWLHIIFTNPNPPNNQANGIDRYVVPVLDAATKTIDVASFDFTLLSVTNALVEASQRGVKVRVVLDEINGSHELKTSGSAGDQDFDALKALQAADIQVVNGGRPDGLMHDKFILVDGAALFMGSWNVSYNDTFRNNNNLLEITDPDLIANYQAKFNELYVDQRFGARAQVKALKPELTIDGVPVENYFSPPDQVMAKVIALVNGAQKSIRFMAFTYTHHNLAAAMITRYRKGIRVEGVIESRGAKTGALPHLFCAGVPVKTDGNPYILHHKVIIIDENTVITGSFNFTVAADTANDDNVLVIHSPAVAALYLQEYKRISSIANPPAASDIDCSNVK